MRDMNLTIFERDLRDPRHPIPRRVVLRYSYTPVHPGDVCGGPRQGEFTIPDGPTCLLFRGPEQMREAVATMESAWDLKVPREIISRFENTP